MSVFYVCTSYDEYDPKTGYMILIIDCIEWDETIYGIWEGPKYSSKEECYSKSICAKGYGSSVSDRNILSNNYCNISINRISLVVTENNQLTFEIELPKSFDNTYIEYGLYDIEFGLIQDFQRVQNTENPLPSFSTFNISIEQDNVCSIAFRLIQPCVDTISEIDQPGSGSGSQETESGSGFESRLFDLSSWENLTGDLPNIRYYLDEAASSWNSIIKYNQGIFETYKNVDPNWNGLALVSYTEINEPGGFIAACGPVQGINILDNDPYNIKTNALTFQLFVNLHYTEPQWGFTASDWINTMAHELGHALGIGIYWNPVNSFWLDGNKYQLASNAYNKIIGDTNNSRKLLPLEDGGGPGTQSSHWEDDFRSLSYPNNDGFSYLGCGFDIMTGFYEIGVPTKISNLSKQFLVDIGYESTGLDIEPLPQLQIQTNTININNNIQPQRIIHNMCGTEQKCGCETHKIIGSINISQKKFISENNNG
jgi:hypothetical protein